MKDRLVVPEILDSLPHTDPEAVRCRRDLRFINAVMGNYRWLRSRILKSSLSDWWELGAGDGAFLKEFNGSQSRLAITGVDFAPRPAHWPESWRWCQGDLFVTLGQDQHDEVPAGCVANLFLHHFKEEELGRLGALLGERFDHLIVSEPARLRLFRFLSYALFPFVSRVTKHDMQVSIGAGFRIGELAESLGLSSAWKVQESISWLGAYRFEAWKDEA